MAAELYPELYQNFFAELEKIRSLNDSFSAAFEPLEHPMHIGRVAISISPRRPGYVSGIKNTNVKKDLFVSRFSFNPDVDQHFQFMFDDEIIYEITIYATASCDQWTVKQITSLAEIAKTTYVFISRLRIRDIAQANTLTDTLTGLPNYLSYCNTCRSHCALGSISKFTALLLNINNFNDINFKYGFVIGDQVLRKFAQFLLSGMLPEESVSRHGGDSFTMLVKKERANDILNKIRRTTIQVMTSDAQAIDITIETDVIFYPIPDGTMDFNDVQTAISKLVIENMHQPIKKEPDMDELMGSFYSELSSGHFAVYYQPKVSLDDNSIIGIEALVRRIDGSVISLPEAFLPEISGDDRVCLLDYFVFDQVCKDLVHLMKEDKAPLVSVNFSHRHIYDEGFVKRIMHIIERYAIDPSYIEIELSTLPDESEYPVLAEFVTEMQDNFLTVSLDNVGVTPLGAMCDLDVNVIKIDRSLTARIGSESADILIKQLIETAGEAGMDVIAEGVETEVQADFYKSLGVMTAQGYYYYKPQPLSELEEKL